MAPDTFDISSKFQKVYEAYFENNGEPEFAIEQIDIFLKEYPYYPEALIFKARMLIALGKHKAALETIELAEKCDKWRLIGQFDKAEIYLEQNRKPETIECFLEATRKYLTELANGIDSYFLALSETKDGETLKKEAFQILSKFWEDPSNEDGVLNELREYLHNNANKLTPCK